MSRLFLAAGTVSALLVVAFSGRTSASSLAEPPSSDQYQPDRVTICHATTSKPPRYVNRTVSRAALPAHLRHGDTTGPCVYGSVTKSGSVALKTAAGRPITVLAARRIYSIVVRDAFRNENFHIAGARVDKRTGIPFVGTVRWRITFAPGLYRYRSDVHPALRRLVTVR